MGADTKHLLQHLPVLIGLKTRQHADTQLLHLSLLAAQSSLYTCGHTSRRLGSPTMLHTNNQNRTDC